MGRASRRKREEPDRLRLPRGHVNKVWETLAVRFEPMTVRSAPDLGPYGECWTNAYLTVALDPERYVYVEGLVTVPGGGTVLVGDRGFIRRGLDYPHAWVYDRADDVGLEVTDGWQGRNARYRGSRLRWDMVHGILGRIVEGGYPTASVLEIATTNGSRKVAR